MPARGVPAALRQDVRFSTAVAGFAQLLRGGRYTGSLTYEDVLREAQASRGEDALRLPRGVRAAGAPRDAGAPS